MKWTRKILYLLGVLLGTLFALTFILSIIGYAYSMVAGPFDRRPDGLIWNPPVCMHNGRPVPTAFLPTEELWKNHVGLASVAHHPRTGVLHIVLDATHFKRMPAELQRFIIHHECGHINLGHLRWLMHDDPQALEMDAECYAMNAVRREGWAPAHFDALYAAMVNRELLGPAMKGILFDERMSQAHAWSPEERVEWARSCPLP